MKIPTYKEQPLFLRRVGAVVGILVALIYTILWLNFPTEVPFIESLHKNNHLLYGALGYFGAAFIGLPFAFGVPFVGGIIFNFFKK